MAVRTNSEILEMLRGRMGDEPDDDAISLLEDVTDTLTDLETRANGDGTDWEQKYKDNDAEWRKRYTDRFFSSDVDDLPDPIGDPEPEPEKKTFADLFTEE